MTRINATRDLLRRLLTVLVACLALAACTADDTGTAPTGTGGGGGVPTATDGDGDGIDNSSDNCPGIANPTQADINHNGIGDACEDTDGDSVTDAQDNCPFVSNPAQPDSNGDGIGDACSGDYDGDGVADTTDNCSSLPNAGQADTNGNGVGDACEFAGGTGDDDADGIANADDNCPAVANPDQKDSDGNGVGDVCDAPIKDICGDGYRPLLAPEAQAFASPTSRLLLVTLSQVSNVDALTDTNAGNHASMNLVADTLGLLGTAYSGVRTVRPQAAGHDVGFVVSGPASLLSLGALNGVSVQTLNGATVQETFDDSSLLTLTLLGGASDPALLHFTPTKSFDAVRINIGGAANVLASLRVHAACTAR